MTPIIGMDEILEASRGIGENMHRLDVIPLLTQYDVDPEAAAVFVSASCEGFKRRLAIDAAAAGGALDMEPVLAETIIKTFLLGLVVGRIGEASS